MILTEIERVALILEKKGVAEKMILEMDALESSNSKDAVAMGRIAFSMWALKKINNEAMKAHRWTIGTKKIFIITREK